MKQFHWTATRKGADARGSVVAHDEREAMRAALTSRSWTGDGWRMKVGTISTAFDAEDTHMLAASIGDEALDVVGTSVKMPSDLLPDVAKKLIEDALDSFAVDVKCPCCRTIMMRQVPSSNVIYENVECPGCYRVFLTLTVDR